MTGPGRVVAGRYRLLERIGGGGMGAVWLAADELLGRQVAVKQVLPPPGADATVTDQQRQRALREGRIAARLSHPHAISVYDVAVEDGTPWLVMEYLPSRSLAEVLKEDGLLTVDQVAQIGAQVADALAATHAAGIVHRDVKPANVLIGRGPRVDGLVKITDFGISHARDDVTLTQTGQITGTPAFLAPEVAQGSEVTQESDVFSLGATLYTCLEGRPPFGMDDNALRLLHRVAAGELDPPRRAGSMTGTLTRMLAVDPAQRPTTVEVRDELARLAAGRDGDPTTVLLARTALRSSTNRERTAELRTGVLPAAGAGGVAAGGVAAAGAAAAAAPGATSPATTSTGTAAGTASTRTSAGTAAERDHGPAAAAGAPPAPPPARRRRRGLLVALALLAVLVAGGAVWLATERDGGTTAEAPASSPPAQTPTPTPSEDGAAPETTAPESTAPETTTSEPAPSTSEAAPSEPPADDPAAVVQQTLGRYYDLLPDDPDGAYAMTGPYLRSRASAGYYRDFWEPWAEVELREVRGAELSGDGVITATTEVAFTGDDGSSLVEVHELRLVRGDGGEWLVDLDLVT
ncbi:serine/threonine-protein kinase [Geodermatophilus sp. DSM 44513]|uniref:serine/threonine-protein kinase n=1 Tax=Geodermatophilus sp. DSM 44513 TaxID=1528104 RepID=UPI00126E2D1F|nr:serine/threonine-protein kinase [Geodermatophilus sp. DSM 44513]WNV76082.1 serine/threonine-protein kinase [Geodermatophilus sp. DSM 44513]